MANQYGKRVNFSTPVTADLREVLAALYAFFDGGGDPNWIIKAAAVIPAQIAAPGDTGFVITDAAGTGIDVAVADHALVGGTMADGGAISTADDLMISIDPEGTISDITSAGFSVGLRWSGWTPDMQASTYNLLSGACKVSSGADWVFFRFKSTSALYNGGGFAGRMSRLDAGIGEGFMVFSGLWTDLTVSSANDHFFYESYDGVWVVARANVQNSLGLSAQNASDSAGNFRTTPLCVVVAANSISALLGAAIVGVIPPVFVSANGTLAKQWQNGALATVGFNMDSGCWVARDDGTDAE